MWVLSSTILLARTMGQIVLQARVSPFLLDRHCIHHTNLRLLRRSELINRNNCAKNSLSTVFPLVLFGLLPGSHRPAFEAHPGANTFPSVCGLTTTSFTDLSASRNTFSVSTITDGNARVGGRSTLSTLTLAWLYIEPSPCGGVRPAGDPVDSDPGAVFEEDRTLVAR